MIKSYSKESLKLALNNVVGEKVVDTMGIVRALDEAAIQLFLMPSLIEKTTRTIKDALIDIRQSGCFCYDETTEK